MLGVVIIEKNGDLTNKNIKNVDKKYSICGYKSDKDFIMLHEYKLNKHSYTYEIYGKEVGKANSENKYELPPPIDQKLYFGKLCILKKKDDEYISFTVDEWEVIYEKLFGGFEDLDGDFDEDGNEIRSVDSEEYDSEEYTKEGYYKDDGFIVDDDELESDEYDSESDDEC